MEKKEITIFAKKRETKEGRKFYSYLATLQKKDGSELTASVKFQEDCGSPKPEDCPCNILCGKSDMNLSRKDYCNPETGEVKDSFTLWVKNWEKGSEYVDHSMDEFF